MSTTREVAERIAETLFRDGSHRAADRLLLIRGETHAGAAAVSNAEYLGGFSKAAVTRLVEALVNEAAIREGKPQE
jgi:hypothetical protein